MGRGGGGQIRVDLKLAEGGYRWDSHLAATILQHHDHLLLTIYFLFFFSCADIVAHVCGDPLSRYTCRATRVAADFLRILGFSGVTAVSRYTPPKKAGRTCRP